MSNSLNKFCVMEPRVAFKDSMVNGNYAIVKGAETYTYRQYTSSSCDNSGINITTPPPSFDDVLSRLAVLEVPVNLVFTGPGDGTDNLMIQSNRDAWRALCLESITKNSTICINGENVTCNVSQVCHPFSRYYMDLKHINEGITPNMLDVYGNYADGDGSPKNPLAWYDNPAQNPRGAYADYEIVTNTNTRAEIRATLRSYIMISPFEWISSSNNVVPGLTQLVSLDWNINFASNLSRIWSRSTSNTVPISNLQVTIGSLTGTGAGTANLRLLWMTPRPEMRSYIRSMPMIRYPYFYTNRSTTSGNGLIAAGSSDTITSNVLNFINVPNALYIYCTKDESTYVNSLMGNLNTPDVFGAIEGIDITMANVTGILSTASPQQLYDISVKNGLQNMTFNEFAGYTNRFNQLVSTFDNTKIPLTGSIIRLQPGLDLSLRNDIAQGVQEKVDFQVTVKVKNYNTSEDIKYQLNILAVYEGYLEIVSGTARTVLGPLSPRDVECNSYAQIDWNDLEKNYGGALGDRFKTFQRKLGNVNQFLKDNKVLSKGLKAASYVPSRFSPALSAASNIARTYGYGMDGGCGDCDGGMLVEEQRGLVGGRQMGHRELKSRLKKRN